MKVGIIGYGKMGKEIEEILINRGHELAFTINSENANLIDVFLPSCDVAIEFSAPEFAVSNIKKCLQHKVPVVIGTTGWYENFAELEKLCNQQNSAFFYATNFSVGVHLFLKANEAIAKLMNSHQEYDVQIEETHHIHKKDAPSGTAITTAERVIQHLDVKKNWKLAEEASKSDELKITAFRKDNVPGTHLVKYQSDIDSIEIIHTAHNRKGFASGAVIAAEWIVDKKGVFTMKDMLS